MYADLLRWTTLSLGWLFFAVLAVFAAGSAFEQEPRAARRALGIGVVVLLACLLAGVTTFPGETVVRLAVTTLPILTILLLLVPRDAQPPQADDTPRTRVDERDIMFARARLTPGTDRFDEYYLRHPDKKAADDAFRAKPGLMRQGSALYHPLSSTAAEASFTTVAQLHPLLDQPPSGEPRPVDAVQMTAFLKQWAQKLGAVSVGITALKPHHLYTHLGRNEPYGQPVDLPHRYGIALTVEMDKEMLASGPHGPTLMESAHQYLKAGTIAVQLAEFIKQWGYPARAHIDGNYRVICPLVARDAGLGEIGRMGLLMTPMLGPRVRLAVVTTDLPLRPDSRVRVTSTIDFCRRCKKCADACPARAIPRGERDAVDGIPRWRINSEACSTYWCGVGTDCGRCMSVCPYSHPDNWLHRPVRWGLRRSALFRAAALALDGVFYGRRPHPRPSPGWVEGKP